MGIPATGVADPSRKLEQAITGTGTLDLGVWSGLFNLSVYGPFTGPIALERTFDNGTNWLNCTRPDGAANSFTSAFSIVVGPEPEQGVRYRLNYALSVGTPTVRVSGG